MRLGKGQIASLIWEDVDRDAGVIVAHAKHVKNGRPHKLVLEGELAEIIERRWTERQYKTPNGDAVSLFVFHKDGRPISEFFGNPGRGPVTTRVCPVN